MRGKTIGFWFIVSCALVGVGSFAEGSVLASAALSYVHPNVFLVFFLLSVGLYYAVHGVNLLSEAVMKRRIIPYNGFVATQLFSTVYIMGISLLGVILSAFIVLVGFGVPVAYYPMLLSLALLLPYLAVYHVLFKKLARNESPPLIDEITVLLIGETTELGWLRFFGGLFSLLATGLLWVFPFFSLKKFL